MNSNPQFLHFAIEAVLAAVVCLLYRRGESIRRRGIRLETEHGLVKKRFEAATAGLHIRLLQVEMRLKERRRSSAPPEACVADAAQFSRGELALLMKVRQIGQR